MPQKSEFQIISGDQTEVQAQLNQLAGPELEADLDDRCECSCWYHRVRHSGGHYERLGAALSETSERQYKETPDLTEKSGLTDEKALKKDI